MAELDLEEFLGYEANSSGGGKFLTKWKKRQPPELRIWLHTRTPFVTLWQHNIPQMRVFEDRQTGETVRKIWGGKFNCLENEAAVLQHQNKRQNGVREIPPQICPLCKMLEWTREQIAAKKLNKAQPLFRFEVPLLQGEEEGDRTDDQLRVVHAGPFTDTLKDLTQQEKIDFRKAGISLKDAWADNGRAKCNFVFRCVDHDNLDDGVQILIETSLVGEKVRQVIRDQMKRQGKLEGNPLLNPYAFQIEHKPKETQFQNKYHVLDLSSKAYPLIDQIKELIVATDPPDISRMREPGNVRSLRAQLEQYALIEFPWDELFGPAEAIQANTSSDEEVGPVDEGDDSFDYGALVAAEAAGAVTPIVQASVPVTVAPVVKTETKPVAPVPAVTTAAAPAATGTRRRKAEPVPLPPPPEPMGDPCDDCGAPMKASDTKCGKCGAEYAVTPEPEVTVTPVSAGTVLGADGVVAGSKADKLNW